MSLFDYEASELIAQHDYSFYALAMAAMRKADSENIVKLRAAFPETYAELEARYNAPGGLLPSDPEARRRDEAADEQAAIHAEAQAEPGYDEVPF